MNDEKLDETRQFWDRVACDWDIQVGDEGDRNRILNSDPVLWAFVGDPSGMDVLDAGCGTGYLTRKLRSRGARAVGVDFSGEMVALAKSKGGGVDFRVDSCSELRTLRDASFDVVVSNYVLMDLPDLDGAVRSFYRVLRHGGIAVVVFSHPCFPAANSSSDDGVVDYRWEHPYFERRKHIDPPWGHFTSDFIWFHRPLSDYWKAFKSAGFDVVDFDEPRLTEDRYHLAADDRSRRRASSFPFSAAFKLRKP